MPSSTCDRSLYGAVRAPLLTRQVSCVLLGVAGPGEKFRSAAYALTEPMDDPGLRSWATRERGIPEGARVRAVGVDVRGRTAVRIGPTFVMREGQLVVDEGGQ